MRYLFLALAILSNSVLADDMVFREGKDSIRITQGECPAVVLALIPEQYRKNFMAASAIVSGKSYQACWMVLNDGRVFVQYDDADTGVLYITSFQPEEGV